MRILLTGRDGQVGRELEPLLAPLGELHAFNRRDLDLLDIDTLIARARSIRPLVIINAAAYTAVDGAESDPVQAFAINATAPGVLAEEAKRLGALLVHYSSDYVFDGSGTRPYVEKDPVNPLNVYGESKLAGEHAIRNSGCRHIILRTSWVYSDRGKNFLLAMLALARSDKEARVVSDQRGSPTWSRALAQTTAKILPAALDDHGPGLFHLSAGGETTWHHFAKRIYVLAGRSPLVTPIRTCDWPTPARRPAYSVLDNTRFASRFGFAMSNWELQLDECMRLLEHR